MADYLTFAALYADCCRLIGDLKQSRLNEVKAVINSVYLDELLNADEMRPLYWLMTMDDSIVMKLSDTVVSISKASPSVMVTAADVYATDDIVSLYEISGMTELDNRTVRLTRTAASTYTLADMYGSAVNSTNYGSAGTGGKIQHRGVAATLAIRQIIGAGLAGYNNQLIPVSGNELEFSTAWWGSNKSRPLRYQFVKAFTNAGGQTNIILWFSCNDAAYRMRLWYEAAPSMLVNDSDVPLLPPQFHAAIESGVVARLGENKAQVEAGVIWPQLYKMQCDALKAYNRRLWKNYEDKQSELYLI